MKDYKDLRTWEDRSNDWLAREMRREGYRNNKSSLEMDHAREEASRGWNAGAISNARQHEAIHSRIKERESGARQVPAKKNSGNIASVFAGFFFILMIMFFISMVINIIVSFTGGY